MDLGWSEDKLNKWINGLDLSFGNKNTLKQEMLTTPFLTLLDQYAKLKPFHIGQDSPQVIILKKLGGLTKTDLVKPE